MVRVTLITATYNSAQTISTCLESVSNQSYNNIEHYIIDGESTDSTISIVKDYMHVNKGVCLISEKDNGIYDALNKGLAHATGDIIGFVHSDDILSSKEIISTVVAQFESGDYDGVHGDLRYVDSKNIGKTYRYWKSSNYNKTKLLNGWMPPHPTLFLKKQVYTQVGMFNTNLKIAADYDLMLRIFNKSELKFKYIPKVFVLMRVGGASNKSLKNIFAKSWEDYKALQANGMVLPIWTLLAKNLQKIPQWIKK